MKLSYQPTAWASQPTILLAMVLAISTSLPVYAEVYEVPSDGNDVVGAITTVPARADETLLDIARRHGLGYEDVKRANPNVDIWIPGEGTEVVLPTRFVLPSGVRRGIILNLAEYRMYYFPEPAKGEHAIVMTYPISIGRMDWETPLGKTSVVQKVTNPSWYPPESVRAEHAADGNPLPRVVPAGPKNPLGNHAMRLGLPGYLIHGTNRPSGVGMRVTHGCIRMFPEDIEFLFGNVAIKTPVRIVNEPVKLGWDGDLLVMEVHPALDVVTPAEVVDALDGEHNLDDIDADTQTAGGEFIPPAHRDQLTFMTEQFVAVTAKRAGQLDWDLAELQLVAANGIPEAVGRAIKNAATSAASE